MAEVRSIGYIAGYMLDFEVKKKFTYLLKVKFVLCFVIMFIFLHLHKFTRFISE